MPFLAELIKLIATVAWTVARGRQGELFRGNSWQKWRVYAVLAFIYMLINNIVFLALLPQQVAAVTLLAATWLTSLVGKIDWTTIPYQP